MIEFDLIVEWDVGWHYSAKGIIFYVKYGNITYIDGTRNLEIVKVFYEKFAKINVKEEKSTGYKIQEIFRVRLASEKRLEPSKRWLYLPSRSKIGVKFPGVHPQAIIILFARIITWID